VLPVLAMAMTMASAMPIALDKRRYLSLLSNNMNSSIRALSSIQPTRRRRQMDDEISTIAQFLGEDDLKIWKQIEQSGALRYSLDKKAAEDEHNSRQERETSPSTKLTRLISLLETGSTQHIRFTAAQQLADIQKAHPEDLFSLLTKVVPYLRHKTWDTRIAASKSKLFPLFVIRASILLRHCE